ncbi:7SK snRNA methylphosphate capping enzyme-like [Astyanax mexicanus]|uniref:RNA methyltransferase n=2 Tax=Astyanax mexicanus TaxID=7994 RepID=A0A8B9JZ35_ASTMX|nr:7SK snRNA methylphosphate capping enzyme-like [Astyanax mexicanus]
MIEMSVDDKETVLPSERPGDASLPPPPQRPTQLLDKCSENHQQPLEKCISKQEGTRSPADRGSEEPEELQEPEKHGNDNIDNHTGPDSSTQIQNGVQQPKSQQKLNKRRSTMSSGFKHPVFGKRRRRANSESESVLPTNFYLGGNIFDPLNLNSMLDEEVNQALNAETPKSSPLPVKNRDPVEILIPRDITDPLNLNSSTAGDEGLLLSPLKSGGGGGGRRRHRNRHHGIIGVGGSGGKGVEGGVLPQIGDFSEAEKGKSETEMMLTSTSSEPPLDCVASEPPEKEALESNSISTQEAQCSSALNSSTDGGDSKRDERPTSGAPVLDTSNPTPSTTISPTATPAVPASHRQRKRKRTSSKSENFGATYCGKANKATTITTTSSGSTSTFTSSSSSSSGVGQPQANRNQGTGLQSIQQQHPNQRKNQKNQQKPNQQHHHQQQQQKKKKFQYGNYDKYYGYRNPGLTEDPRLRTLKPEWFRGKEVLDLGCNTGRLTLSIAMNWRPSRIVGLDIDGSLIHAARKNILYFLSEMHVMKSRSGEKDESGDKAEKPETTSLEKNYKSESPVDMEVDKEGQEGEKDGVKEEEEMVERREKVVEKRSEDGVDGDAKKTKGEEEAVSASSASSSNGNCVFPVSLRISRGPIAAPPLPDTKPPSPGNFPANVSFVKGNYVLDSDLLLVTQREEFDVILCLSVTKWVHLNWGDVGLKRLFHRVYRHLRPGGTFILEPQPWNSYSKRKKLTETITKNYYSICLKPEQFSTYLISEVGFSSYELIGTPSNLSRGFQRPIYLFHKGPAPQK